MVLIDIYLRLSDPDFGQGFDLFCKYSRNQSLMSYIGRKRDMEMLRYELQKLSKMGNISINPHYQTQYTRFNRGNEVVQEKQQKVAEKVVNEKVHIVDERRVSRDELPQEMKELYDEITEDYKLQRNLHEKMKLANSDTGRKEFREQIMELQQKIKARWETIDKALSGDIPVTAPPEKIHVNSHRAYISKMLSKQEMTAQQHEAVKQKVEELLAMGEVLKPETLAKLKAKGF